MTPTHRTANRYIAIHADDYIEMDFATYEYEGPRTMTVTLSDDDALCLLDDLAALFGVYIFEPDREPAKPSLRMVWNADAKPTRPCYGDCPDCDGTCGMKDQTTTIRVNPKPQTKWTFGPSYGQVNVLSDEDDDEVMRWCLWHDEPLPVGDNTPHQKEGS